MSDNENNVHETTSVENYNESNSMSDFEILSTPNVSQDNKIKF